MEHYKIYKLLNDSTLSKFLIKKWTEVNDLSRGQYSVNKNIRFKTSMLRSDLYDYSDVYIVVKGRISFTGINDANRRNKKLTFKNNSPFRSCITKINNTFAGNAEGLDFVMPMYNLLEYSDNYSMTSGSLWNYYRDGINDDENEIENNGNKINNRKTAKSKSFKQKRKIIGSAPDNENILNADVAVPSKHLSSFWRSLDLHLINCEIELALRWVRNCVIFEITRTFRVVSNVDPVTFEVVIQTTSAKFQINNAKLYNPVVTLSINDNTKVLEKYKIFLGTNIDQI